MYRKNLPFPLFGRIFHDHSVFGKQTGIVGMSVVIAERDRAALAARENLKLDHALPLRVIYIFHCTRRDTVCQRKPHKKRRRPDFSDLLPKRERKKSCGIEGSSRKTISDKTGTVCKRGENTIPADSNHVFSIE